MDLIFCCGCPSKFNSYEQFEVYFLMTIEQYSKKIVFKMIKKMKKKTVETINTLFLFKFRNKTTKM